MGESPVMALSSLFAHINWISGVHWATLGTWAAVVVALMIAVAPTISHWVFRPHLKVACDVGYPCFRSDGDGSGNIISTTVRVMVRNDGRRDAHNVRVLATRLWSNPTGACVEKYLDSRPLEWSRAGCSTSVPRDSEHFVELIEYRPGEQVWRLLGCGEYIQNNTGDYAIELLVLSEECAAVRRVVHCRLGNKLSFQDGTEPHYVERLEVDGSSPRPQLYDDPLSSRWERPLVR